MSVIIAGTVRVPPRRMSKPAAKKLRRMPATNMAATGTSVMVWPAWESLKRIGARSFLQNSRSTRLRAMGLTFQVSPEI